MSLEEGAVAKLAMPWSDATKLQAPGEIFSPIIFWTLMLSLGSELVTSESSDFG